MCGLNPITDGATNGGGHLQKWYLNGTKVPTFPTYIRNTDLGSNIGAPGISLPCSGETSLPIGIEIDGLPDQDQKLLSLANAIEMMLTS